MINLWQRQPYETDAAFAAFSEYYLTQDPARSVVAAYHRWRIGKYGANIEQKKQASGMWNNWAAGRTSKGDTPENSYTWAERAAAFDDHLAGLRIAELEKRHMPPAEVIALLSDIARGDLGDFSEVQGLDSLKEHPKSYLINNLIERVSHNDKTGSVSRNFQIKMESKLDALEKIGKHYGIFSDNITLKVEGELDKVLDQLEQSLDAEIFQKVIEAIAQNDS